MSDNAGMAEAVFEAWERRDFEAVVENMVEDVCVNWPGGTVTGKPDVMAWYTSWYTACPDSGAGAVCVGVTHDTAVMEGVYAGTNTGPFGPYPATGRTVDVPWANVYRFNTDGHIVSVNAYIDQVTLLTQLGHMEPPQ